MIALESKSLSDSSQSVSDWNDSFISTHKSSAAHVQAGLRVRYLLDKDSREQNEKTLIETLSFPTLTLAEATAGLELLEEWRSGGEAVAAYKEAAGTTAVAVVSDVDGSLTAIKTGLSSSATRYEEGCAGATGPCAMCAPA